MWPDCGARQGRRVLARGPCLCWRRAAAGGDVDSTSRVAAAAAAAPAWAARPRDRGSPPVSPIRRGEAGWNRTTPREADHCQPEITRKSRRERERERGSMRASGRASAVARRLFLFYHRPRRRIRNLRSPLSQIKTIKEPQLSLYCEGKRCIEFLPS